MSTMDSKEIMKNLGLGTVIAGVKVGVDYFSGKKPSFWNFGKMFAMGAVGELINDQIKKKSWYPFEP